MIDKQFIEIVLALNTFFNDPGKVADWLNTHNPHFGNLSPINMIVFNRGHKVHQFILSAIEENRPL